MTSQSRWSRSVDDARAMLRMAICSPKLLPIAKGSPAERVRHWAKRRPADLAIAYADRRVSWRDVDEAADAYASRLRESGVAIGDVVALMMDNRPEFLFAFTAISRIGAVAALINTEVRGEPLAHALRTSRPAQIVTGAEHLERILDATRTIEGFVPDKQIFVQVDREEDRDDPSADTRGLRSLDASVEHGRDQMTPPDVRMRLDQVCCYVFTSGTTGLPKAAVISNQRILGGGFTFGNLMHRCGPGDLIYVSLPLFHSSALFLGWGSALATGAAIGLRRRFSVREFWNDIRRFHATSFLYIGELCRYLLAAPPTEQDGRHSLRTAVGNGMRPELWEEFQQRFHIPVIREFYGATEGNVPLLNMSGRVGLLGRKKRGQFVARCDAVTGEATRNAEGMCEPTAPGEIGLLLGKISRVMRFDGYVDASASQKKILVDVRKRGDTYFNTGDLVKLDEDGWLAFVDRVGDTYRWKGENVSTQEVAGVVTAAPGVREAVVYGVEIPGCEGRAGMVSVAVDEGFELDALTVHVRDQLPGYQQPLFVRVLAEGVRTTSTFKQRAVSYREEGFDPSKTHDELFVSRSGSYERLDPGMHRDILARRWVPS